MLGYKNKTKISPERRKYIRLDTVFPVQFRLSSIDGEKFLSAWLQGFTSNISRGGISLEVHDLPADLFKLIQEKKVKLAIEIEVPLIKRPICAAVIVAWTKIVPGLTNRFLIGLDYEKIDLLENKKLLRYAHAKQLFLPVVVLVICGLIFSLILGGYSNQQLIKKNKQLINQLVSIAQKTNLANENLRIISLDRLALQKEIKDLASRIANITGERNQQVSQASAKAQELNALILQLTQEKNLLLGKLNTLQQKEGSAQAQALVLDQERIILEKANFDQMYLWLKTHQNNRTGLVMSFEGDAEIASWAFTYDQALLIQLFTNFNDFTQARKILDFYAKQAKREAGWFLNAYYDNDGAPAEFILHCGPNIWLGVAIMQYTQKTKDENYLIFAEEIAQNIMQLQDADIDNGIRGGPQMSWYSTEHNLDAYAFFRMLAQVTGKKIYQAAAEKTLDWLVRHTYSREEIPVKRGKGDATIATDTYAWSIAAIGVEKLKKLGMDPDKIMEFVEENCKVEVDFKRPSGDLVKIQGFDFAPQQHLGRGGVVSSEWTAQMVVSYKMLADFYKNINPPKAQGYAQKAQLYLSQLNNMIISSSSPSGQGQGCLPYATQDNVDTGHGWKTPKGNHTGSVSGTAYTIFAYYGFNPLELKE